MGYFNVVIEPVHSFSKPRLRQSRPTGRNTSVVDGILKPGDLCRAEVSTFALNTADDKQILRVAPNDIITQSFLDSKDFDAVVLSKLARSAILPISYFECQLKVSS